MVDLSPQTAATVRIAFMTRRDFLLDEWKKAHKLGIRNEFVGTAFWARQILKLNDAAYEVLGQSKGF